MKYLLLFATILHLPSFIFAQERVALVIGNGAYPGESALANPTRDADLIAESLKISNFKVIRGRNQSKGEMETSLKEFSKALTSNTTALFYYAGHGAQWQNTNYLLPIDIPATISDSELPEHSLAVNSVLQTLSQRKSARNIIILDCCRNNPYTRGFQQAKKGLAELKAPQETYICYATGLGEEALDGSGKNSPFTAALASEIIKPNIKLDDVFKNVAATVSQVTDRKQLPWRQSNGVQDFFFIRTQEPDNPFRVKKATWSQGELSFTLVNLLVTRDSKATATLKIKNISKRSSWKLALDATSGQGFQAPIFYGGKLESGSGATLSCTTARGIYTKVYLVNFWDSDRLIQEQSAGYDPALVQNWLSQMNSLAPGEETLVSLVFQPAAEQEGRPPTLDGKLVLRGNFYGAPESNDTVGKVTKLKPFFEEILPNREP